MLSRTSAIGNKCFFTGSIPTQLLALPLLIQLNWSHTYVTSELLFIVTKSKNFKKYTAVALYIIKILWHV